MEGVVWNAILTVLMALLGWAVKVKDKDIEDTKRDIEAARGELGRVTILLNRTREEVAKEYVTKADVHNDINRVLDRLDRLETKLDTFIRGHHEQR
jgi:hypothetical protein